MLSKGNAELTLPPNSCLSDEVKSTRDNGKIRKEKRSGFAVSWQGHIPAHRGLSARCKRVGHTDQREPRRGSAATSQHRTRNFILRVSPEQKPLKISLFEVLPPGKSSTTNTRNFSKQHINTNPSKLNYRRSGKGGTVNHCWSSTQFHPHCGTPRVHQCV